MLKVFPSGFLLLSILLVGSIMILFVSSSTINAFSQATESSSRSNTFINSNPTGSGLLNDTNMKLLDSLGLATVYQPLEREIAKIMDIAYQSMNLTNSFGSFPLSNLTADMQQKYRGIPSDQDIDKRNEAKSLLETNTYLSFIGMTFPNGDTYFSEPYFPSQTNSSAYNYGYRDHIIGALESKHPYLSNVITAASTGKPLVVLASPIFSGETGNNTIIGLLALGFNLEQFDNLIKSESLDLNNTRLVLVDNNGTEISDSESNTSKLETFKGLQSIEKAKSGQVGSMSELINGRNMSVSYAPIDIAQSKWILLSITPN
ncbi:MAG: cache domain-containing protein [Candidatus Nitrosocosmicus sp.]|nr:cache domain-containing protein [Candidatus Nitrosocosmicus sp.]